jgi:hypothetical protein
MFLEPNSILFSTEIIVNKALECHIDMQMTKKGEQLLKNVKNSTAL